MPFDVDRAELLACVRRMQAEMETLHDPRVAVGAVEQEHRGALVPADAAELVPDAIVAPDSAQRSPADLWVLDAQGSRSRMGCSFSAWQARCCCCRTSPLCRFR